MKTIVYFLIISFTFFACSPSQRQEEQVEETWTSLINGNELQGWKSQGDVQTVVTDNIMRISGEGDWLFYDKELDDFLFASEFLLKANTVAAIGFRYHDEQTVEEEFPGYKVILDHNPDQQNTMGSIYTISRAKSLKSTQNEDWSKLVIEASGDHLQVYINDTLVTETHDRKSDEGMIGLQVFGKSNDVQFRNMKIKELEEEDYLGPQIEDYMRAYTKIELHPLADTTSLNDWSQTGDAIWDIKDGVIHGVSGEKGGFLIHKGAYRNFYLKLNFKIRHEDNSGIFIRHIPSDTALVTTDNAIECNIYDHDGFTHEYSTGAIAPIARAWSKMIDYENWNEMEIFAFEDQICLYINGIKSSEAHLPEKFNQKGNICIQGGIQVFNGNLPSDIYIKNLQIRDFEDVPFLGF